MLLRKQPEIQKLEMPLLKEEQKDQQPTKQEEHCGKRMLKLMKLNTMPQIRPWLIIFVRQRVRVDSMFQLKLNLFQSLELEGT